jgi:hypothetical protein
MYLTPTEIFLHHLLRRQNFSVDYYVYDETVPINEVITKERVDTQGKDSFWSKSCHRSRQMLNAGRIDYNTIPMSKEAASISESLEGLDEILAFRFQNVDFGNIVEGALYRYYKSLAFGTDVESVARQMLITALSNYLCVRNLCEQNDYRYVMFSHGIYITWQPVVEYCRQKGIDYICYDRAKTKDHGNFNVNQPSPDWSIEEGWKRYADRQLTHCEKKQVQEYLTERELQKGDVYAYNFSGRAENLEIEKRRLGIPLDRKCVTIFTNLIWDAANVSRDIAFPSALECVISTIESFRERADIQVVVRSHPAEKVLGTEERYASLVKEHFGHNLPDNVTLITAEDDVNSFTMIDITDVGVVNTSTVGLEMAVLGKPVILIAETHYRNKGFTYDATNPVDYFNAIETALDESNIETKKVDLAEKYFFMMMFLYQVRLPSVYQDGVFKGYSFENFHSIPSDDPLVKIVEKMANSNHSFLEW